MEYNKLKNIIKISIILIFLLTLTGCGKIKDENEIKKYIQDKYNINIEIVSVEEGEQYGNSYKEYLLKDTDRNIFFSCKSSIVSVGMDGSTFWHQDSTTDDYFEKVTESISDKISEIQQKYNVKFEVTKYGDSYMEAEKDDKNNITNALNELMKAYDLKSVEYKHKNIYDSIFIIVNGEDRYSCDYTINGENIKLEEFDIK